VLIAIIVCIGFFNDPGGRDARIDDLQPRGIVNVIPQGSVTARGVAGLPCGDGTTRSSRVRYLSQRVSSSAQFRPDRALRVAWRWITSAIAGEATLHSAAAACLSKLLGRNDPQQFASEASRTMSFDSSFVSGAQPGEHHSWAAQKEAESP
jgi:hypothetical protein